MERGEALKVDFQRIVTLRVWVTNEPVDVRYAVVVDVREATPPSNPAHSVACCGFSCDTGPMPETATPKPVMDGVATDRAWQVGRRIYIRCGYNSRLNQDLIALGAKWDAEQRARWVGSSKKTQVVALLEAQAERIAAIEAVKVLGLWLAIPFDATAVREAAKAAGAIWDEPRKQWAFRDEATLDQVTEQRDRWVTERDERHRVEEETVRAAAAEADRIDLERAAQAASTRLQRILDESGRTLTGETTTHTVVSTRRMNKHTASELAHEIGTVITLSDGRRGIVTGRKIWFTNQDMASSVCWHPQTHDEAHWDFQYDVSIVTNTPDEDAKDARAAAELADAAEIHGTVEAARRITTPHVVDRWTPIPATDRAGSISIMLGTTGAVGGGQVILTRTGQVVWQHPGFYDDFVRTEGISDDPGLVGRVRAILAEGTRERVQRGQLPAYYSVTADA